MENSDFNTLWGNMGRNYVSTLKKAFDYKGRANKFEYWGFVFINMIISFGLGFFGQLGSVMANAMGVIAIIFSLVMFVPQLSLFVRRLHDRNRSGKILWILVLLILFAIVLGAAGGISDYKNEYAEPSFLLTIIYLLVSLSLLVLIIYITIMPMLPSKGDNKYGEKINQTKSEAICANIFIVIYYLIQFAYAYMFMISSQAQVPDMALAQKPDFIEVQENTIDTRGDVVDTIEISTEADVPAAPDVPMNVSVDE